MKIYNILGTMAIITAFIATYILGFFVMPVLKKLKAGQTTKEIGPVWHKSKNGTPTMGGIFLIIGIMTAAIGSVISAYFLKNNLNIHFLAVSNSDLIKIYTSIFCAFALGIVGFMDDYIKVVLKRNTGLLPLQKTSLQLIIVVAYFATLYINNLITTTVYLPFFGQTDFKFFYYIISVVGMYGIINAVNLTDGLDGLASSVTAVYALTFIIISKIFQNFGINILACSVFGGCIGFLMWNIHPAKVFMGDTGSMFLGGLVASLGFGINEPVLILIVGIIYVIEAMSVVIQVCYFKLTGGKRIFKMSPIHHHFELSGYGENKILILFCIITAIFGLIGIAITKTL